MPAVPATATAISDHVRSMAQSIASVLRDMQDADQTRDDAKDALAGAREGAVNVREKAMVSLATTAQNLGWSMGDIETATRLAVAQSNAATKKAMETFSGELRSAMHPNVREHIKDIIAVRDEAVEMEALAAPGDPKPIKKAFARKYHLLTTLLGEAKAGRFYTTVADIVAFAEARNPDLDTKKVLARLKAIIGQLTSFQGDFPVDNIGACIDFLNEITEKDLREARKEPERVAAPAVVSTTNTAPEPEREPAKVSAPILVSAPVTKPAPKPTPTVVAETKAPVVVTVDDIDALLNPGGFMELRDAA